MAVERVVSEKAPAAIGPYSQAIKLSRLGLVFTSGQIPINPETGEIISGSIEKQAIQVFENLKAVLEASGTSLDKVVKVTVYMKNLGDFQRMNDIYAKYFTGKPARSTVQVASLPKDVDIEVDAIAIL